MQINLIMFGKTAKQWEIENPEFAKKGLNIKDAGEIEHLIVLSGLETLNAYLINQGEYKNTRMKKLVVELEEILKVFVIRGLFWRLR